MEGNTINNAAAGGGGGRLRLPTNLKIPTTITVSASGAAQTLSYLDNLFDVLSACACARAWLAYV